MDAVFQPNTFLCIGCSISTLILLVVFMPYNIIYIYLVKVNL